LFYGPYRSFGSLQDFPVINKATIKAQYEAFRSDAFQGAHLHAMSTSGSTGTPFTILQDPDKRRRVLAEMICFGRRAGYQVGDRYLFTRIWNSHNRKPWHVALRENAVMFDISSMDDARLESLAALLRTDTNIQCLLGYPSTLENLLRVLDRGGKGPEPFHLRSIICVAERLAPHVRKALRARFKCTVVSRYSNQENGVFAQQCPDHEEYHLNTASYVFEFLKLDEDLPAAPGDQARVVITDLFNHAMPMIRYDTGDVVTRQASAACGWSTETLSGIEGRRLDLIYDTRDQLVSPFALCSSFWPFTGLKQYQFIQEAKGTYRIILNGAKDQYQDDEFIEMAKGIVGSDAAVSVAHVDQIPQLASGKFVSVLSHYRPTV
jgi:phenylacetate-CoA ligase